MSFPIPVQAFEEAYEATGKRPIHCAWHNAASGGDPEGVCPLSAVLIHKHPFGAEVVHLIAEADDDFSAAAESLRSIGYEVTKNDVRSFVEGVDQYDDFDEYSEHGDIRVDRETYEYGQQVARALEII